MGDVSALLTWRLQRLTPTLGSGSAGQSSRPQQDGQELMNDKQKCGLDQGRIEVPDGSMLRGWVSEPPLPWEVLEGGEGGSGTKILCTQNGPTTFFPVQRGGGTPLLLRCTAIL